MGRDVLKPQDARIFFEATGKSQPGKSNNVPAVIKAMGLINMARKQQRDATDEEKKQRFTKLEHEQIALLRRLG
jgi:hypothetical protein